MKKIINKISYIMIALLVLKTMLTYSQYIKVPDKILTIVELMVYGYIGVFILFSMRKLSKVKILIFIIIGALTFYTGYIVKSFILLSSFLILCATFFLDREKVIKTIFYTIISVLIVHFVIYAINYFNGNTKIIYDKLGRHRHRLGFVHPNISAIYSLWAFIAFIYLNRNSTFKSLLVKLLVSEIIILMIYRLNQTRTELYCSIILIALFIIARLKIFNRLIKLLSKYMFVIITLFVILSANLYNKENPIAIKANEIVNSRIAMVSKAIDTFGYTAVGQYADEKSEYIITDVAYSMLLYKYGIVYIILIALLSHYAARRNSVYEQILIIVWCIFAFFETYSLNFIIAFAMLFGSDWLGIGEKMIPKKIHYCWFGKGKKTELMKNCIKSWKKFLPDYEIIEWNETNFNVNQSIYAKEAYKAKKYSFVSDYARLKIIYDNGGIYFDCDIELIKDMQEILEKGSYFACENGNVVNTGLGFAAERKNEVVKAMLDEYKDLHFINENNKMALVPCPIKNTNALVKLGWDKQDKLSNIKGVTIYPTNYFCPYNYNTGEMKITENTYSIHHCEATWLDDYEKKLFNDKKKLVARFGKKLGKILYYIEKFFVLLVKDPKKILAKFKEKK